MTDFPDEVNQIIESLGLIGAGVLELKVMTRDPMELTESGAIDSAPNHLSLVQRPIDRTLLRRCVAVIATVVLLFYAVVGYVGSANTSMPD